MGSVTGDSLNGLTDSLTKMGAIRWMATRHEEVAAFAAGAEAQISGKLAVCAGSCGPGNLHLINGLFDCHRNRVPVLAIAAHIPSSEIGSGYFQETKPQELFRQCSHYCELITHPAQLPYVLNIAMRKAILDQGVSVIVLPGDVALQTMATEVQNRWSVPDLPQLRPTEADIAKLAELLNGAEKITLFCGRGCAESHAQVVALAEILNAPIVSALRGKAYLEYDNPYYVGLTGLIGLASGYHAVMRAQTLLLLGTRFPYRAFYPSDATLIQVDTDPLALGAHCSLDFALQADVGATLDMLLPLLHRREKRQHLDSALKQYADTCKDLEHQATANDELPIHPQYLAQQLNQLAAKDAVFSCDVGTPTVWAARYLRMNGQRHLLGSFSHGSMANALAQALGAQAAAPTKQVIALCGDGGFTMLMGDLLSAIQLRLPIKIILVNNSALGFVALEMKAGGYLTDGTDLQNPNFAALAEACGMKGVRVEKASELTSALQQALAHDGPVLVDVVTAKEELVMPPHLQLEQAKGFSLYALRAIINGRGNELIDLAKTNCLR